jgi:protein-tyrosine phosphatase
MSEIIPNLWLGPIGLTYDSEFLTTNKISHVVRVLEDQNTSATLYSLGIKTHYIKLYDDDDQPIGDYFDSSISFIDDAIRMGKTVYVHCYAGVSRSPTIVAAYLIKMHNMTTVDALKYIAERRPCIDPNEGFRAALRKWETVSATSFTGN